MPFSLPTRGRLLLGLLSSLLLVAAVLCAYTWIVLSWSYSNGERAGYVQKFSRKGWLCKTWEGELAMVSIPGTTPEIFRFSVRDDAVAAAINGQIGNRVSLLYEQHVGVPTDCFGETEYFIVGIKRVEGFTLPR